MSDFDAVALFCDDIREEKSGAHSLIGVMADNVRVPGFPGALPKLAIHIKINLPIDFAHIPIDIFITNPGSPEIFVNTITAELITNSIETAVVQGSPLAGIISNVIAGPFPTIQPGRVLVTLKGAFGTKLIGGLNIQGPEETSALSTNGQQPPA